VSAGEFRDEWRKVPTLQRAAMWPMLIAFIAVRLVMPRDRLLRQVMGRSLMLLISLCPEWPRLAGGGTNQ
jgi:hypothetical protein